MPEENMKRNKANIRATLLLLLLCPLLAVSASAGAINYTYDSAGRLVKTDYGGGKSIQYTYDNAGNLLDRTITESAQPYTLTVQKDGTGRGTVTSAPAGIDCGVDCAQDYDDGTQVALTATADAGSVFAGWSGGGCSGSGVCTVTMNADQTVIATFNENGNGTLQFSTDAYTVNEDGGTVTITVTRAGGSEDAVSVDYATSDGTATAGEDYTAASGTLEWADGDGDPKTFAVAIIDDTLVKGDKTVNLTLSSPTGGAGLGTPNTAVLTIVDNDVGPAPPGSSGACFIATVK